MQPIVDYISRAWTNKHTSTAVIVAVAAFAAGEFFPSQKEHVNNVMKMAMLYGLFSVPHTAHEATAPPNDARGNYYGPLS